MTTDIGEIAADQNRENRQARMDAVAHLAERYGLTTEVQAAEAMRRLVEHINRSAGQHARAIVRGFAFARTRLAMIERDYLTPREAEQRKRMDERIARRPRTAPTADVYLPAESDAQMFGADLWGGGRF